MERSFVSLSERIGVLEKLLRFLVESGAEIESRKRNRQSMVEIECPIKSLERVLHDPERNEEGYERQMKKQAAAEDELNSKRRESFNDVKMGEEVSDEHAEWEDVARVDVQSIHRKRRRTLEEIESREQNLERARECLAEREREVDLIIKTLDERISAVDAREKEFNCFQERKMNEILLNEVKLEVKREELAEQEILVDENLRKLEELKKTDLERLEFLEKKLEEMREEIDKRLREVDCREKLVDGNLRKLEEFKKMDFKRLEFLENKLEEMREDRDKRLREVECRENVVFESVALSLKEGELLKESMEKQLEEFGKLMAEFNLSQEEKMRELNSKEQLLNETSEEKMRELNSKEQLLNEISENFSKDAKLKNEEMIAGERMLNNLLKRLKLAKDNVESLKGEVDKRFKMVLSKEIEVDSTIEWVERRMDKVDSKAEKMKAEQKRIKKLEERVMYKEKVVREKEMDLDLTERALQAWEEDLEVKQREVDSAQEFNQRRSEKLDAREKSQRELMRNCYNEHRATKRRLKLEKDLVESVARFLGLKEENLKHAMRELEFRESSTDNSNSHVWMKPDDSVDLKFTVRMDGKNLQMFLNDPEKDMESMGEEIFKVLHLSSDPAKLVLDAMVGFYPPHLRIVDTTAGVRATCIALLKQLMNMSRKIKPRVREEALKLALEWKFNMSSSGENPTSLEVVGFLLLLATYDVASSFDKEEISSFLMMVAAQKEASKLSHLLGLAEA